MVPDAVRSYRLGMWLFLCLGAVLLALAVLGARLAAARAMGFMAIAGFVICLGLAALLALRSRRAQLEERDRTAQASSLVIMAGMLRQESDQTLERIAGSAGPAAQAAAMLLARRRGRDGRNGEDPRSDG